MNEHRWIGYDIDWHGDPPRMDRGPVYRDQLAAPRTVYSCACGYDGPMRPHEGVDESVADSVCERRGITFIPRTRARHATAPAAPEPHEAPAPQP